MGIGRKRGPGGGGASLNFAVKAYPSEAELLAAVPKENTIGIITASPVTDWFFNATEPEAAAGRVWFKTDKSSPVAFNALKKNGIQVNPTSAKQYLSGSWVEVTAKTRHGGAWVDWIPYLYNAGDECVGRTGGWKIVKSDGKSTLSPHTNKDNGLLYLHVTQGNGAAFVTQNKVSTVGYKKLKFHTTKSKAGRIGLWNSNSDPLKYDSYVSSFSFDLSERDGDTYELDLSGYQGEYYVALTEYAGAAGSVYYCYVDQIWLE